LVKGGKSRIVLPKKKRRKGSQKGGKTPTAGGKKMKRPEGKRPIMGKNYSRSKLGGRKAAL